MRAALLLLPLLLVIAPLRGGTPITIGETLKLPSKILQEERTILVSLPRGYARGTERYPVLYMTDGDAHFTHTRGTVDYLRGNGLMPDLIIVGIANTDRTRDLSPTKAHFKGEDGTVQELPTSGGAPRFLDFFEKELFPYIESTYRTAPYRIFAGHSLGGLLALHTLAARPELFQAYLAASPSLAWDSNYPLRALTETFRKQPDLARTLFVTMADEEKGQTRPNRFDRLVSILKGHKAKGFRWEAKPMPEEDHGTVVLRTHYWGLRHIFQGWRMDPAELPTLGALKAHYAALSLRMGYAIPMPEAAVNQAGYRLLGAKRPQEAIAVLRHNAELYPASANVHDSLGEALEQAGQLKEAHASYGKAVELGAGQPFAPVYQKNRDRVAAALVQK